jgi:hypothetical protein
VEVGRAPPFGGSQIYPLTGNCQVSPSSRTQTIVLGGDSTCTDGDLMTDMQIQCMLQPDDQTILVVASGRLFKSDTCPNSVQVDLVTLSVPVVPNAFSTLHIELESSPLGISRATYDLLLANRL